MDLAKICPNLASGMPNKRKITFLPKKNYLFGRGMKNFHESNRMQSLGMTADSSLEEVIEDYLEDFSEQSG